MKNSIEHTAHLLHEHSGQAVDAARRLSDHSDPEALTELDYTLHNLDHATAILRSARVITTAADDGADQ